MKKSPASVAERLAKAHAALLQDLHKLEEAARPESGEGLTGLTACLGTALDHITAHFRFEEENGYLDVVRTREPRLERAVQQLAEEHRQLNMSLETLLGEARAATGLGPGLGTKVREWVEQIRRHEAREDQVVQDAFNMDLGAED
jgi:hypothetical protein